MVISGLILLRMTSIWVIVTENIKTPIFCSINFFRTSYRLWDNVEEYDTTRQATNYSMIWRKRFACWLTQVIKIHTEYVLLLLFLNNCYASATEFYVYAFVDYLVYSLCNISTKLPERQRQGIVVFQLPPLQHPLSSPTYAT